MDKAALIADALAERKDGIAYSLSKQLSDLFPNKHLMETQEDHFNLFAFAYDGKCCLKPKEGVHSQWQHGWSGSREAIWKRDYNAWQEVEWEGHHLDVLTVGWLASHCRETHHFILGSDKATVWSFFEAVCRWNSEIRGEVLVFDEGHWEKSQELFDDIQSISFADLILRGELRDEIMSDLTTFFTSREQYERYGIAWKRGVLFLGPPGNGKTHAVKASVNLLGKPCLYVKSFSAPYQTESQCVKEVFERAREAAPCVLIFEDLDSLLTDENRAFFLNEMDGFAQNSGILTIATTNHPERLDPAILERPSRFDRKYTFDLPALEERTLYLSMFSARLEPELQLNSTELDEVAQATEGYSFAYLKELYVSSMLKWIGDHGKVPIAQVMGSQIEKLLAQMGSEPETLHEDGDPRARMMRQMMARRRR